MKSIKTKILCTVIVGLLVITAVVSTIGVQMTHEVMHRDADRILKNAAQREAAKINDTLGDVMKSISIMEHYATSELENPEQLRDESFLDQYLLRAELMFTEVAMNTSGIRGFYMRIDPAWADGTTGFYRMLAENGTLQGLAVTDLTKYSKDDKQNVSWYYDAVEAGKGIWMDPYRFPGQEKLMITYAQPLYVAQELVGVIGFDMDFSYLISRIDEIAVYEDGTAILLARDGVTIYNQSEQNIQTDHGPHTQSREELKNGMYLELCADYKDIQRDIRPILGRIVMAFLAVLAVAIVYTVFMTQRIVKPLKQLTAAAEAISSGAEVREMADLPVESRDEIGTLSRVLRNAYARILEYTAYINALAYRDSLTGIKNTTAYTEAIRDLNKEICTGNPRFGVLVADINNLKQTNDRFGHDVGNDLIVHTARILMDTFRASVVYRIGGDEFVVLLQDEDLKNYHALMEQMDAACAKDHLTVCENTVPVSVARGVAVFDSGIDRIYEDVFAKADQAMYMHKEKSKVAVP